MTNLTFSQNSRLAYKYNIFMWIKTLHADEIHKNEENIKQKAIHSAT